MRFQWWLYDELRRRSMTQVEFAERVGRSAPTISKWLSGKDVPRLDSVDQIASALDVRPETVLAVLRGKSEDDARSRSEKRLEDLLQELQARLPNEIMVTTDPYMDDSGVLGDMFLPYLPMGGDGGFDAFITNERHMYPLILPGDLLVYTGMKRIKDNDLVVGAFSVHGGWREVMRYVGNELRSDTDGFAIPLENARSVNGRVVTVIRDIDHANTSQPQLSLGLDDSYHNQKWFREAVSATDTGKRNRQTVRGFVKPTILEFAETTTSDDEPDEATISTTSFWRWARKQGFPDRRAVEAAIGKNMEQMTPREAFYRLREHIARANEG